MSSETSTPVPFQRRILLALQNGRHIYGGTVPEAEIARRRAAIKVARKSRRVNRRQK